MIVTIIGGPHHGQTRDLPDGSTAWLDFVRAETYMFRKITWGELDEKTGEKLAEWTLRLAVWPGLMQQGPQVEQIAVTNGLNQLALGEYMRAHGEMVAPAAEGSES